MFLIERELKMNIKGISLVVEGRFGLGSLFVKELDEKWLKEDWEVVSEKLFEDDIEGFEVGGEEEFVGLKNLLDGDKFVYVCGDDGLEMVVGLEENFDVEELRKVMCDGVMEIYNSEEVKKELVEYFDVVVKENKVGELIKLY